MKVVFRKFAVGASYLFLLSASAGTAYAAGITAPVPEIDSGSTATAVALLVGGYLVALSMFRRK